MRVVTAQEVAAALPWEPLVERLAHTFREGVESPPRHHHAMQRPDGEAGDILQAIDEGAFAFDAIRAELAELLRGEKPGRSSPEAITLLKSVGASLEDLAAAIEVWERLGAVER